MLPLPLTGLRGLGNDSECYERSARAIAALNEMGGCGKSVPKASKVSAAQRCALVEVSKPCSDVPPCPRDLSAKAAIAATLGSSSGYFDEVITGLKHTVYQAGKVSLPRVSAGTKPLEELCPEPDRELLVNPAGVLIRDIPLDEEVATMFDPV